MNWYKRAFYDDVPIVNIKETNGLYIAEVDGDTSLVNTFLAPLRNGSWKMVERDSMRAIGEYPNLADAYDAYIKRIKKELKGIPDSTITPRTEEALSF